LSTIEIEPFYNVLSIHHATDHKDYYLDWKREERPQAGQASYISVNVVNDVYHAEELDSDEGPYRKK
jgi:hypothetical protein